MSIDINPPPLDLVRSEVLPVLSPASGARSVAVNPSPNRYSILLAREARRSAQDARAADLAEEALGILRQLLASPVVLALLGVTASHKLSVGEHITGIQAGALQVAFLTPAFLAALAEVAKSAADIVSVTKYVRALRAAA